MTAFDMITENDIIKKTAMNHCIPGRNKPMYIAIHYTAGTTSKPGSAINTAIFFKGNKNNGSADYIVDDRDIVQYNPDPSKYYCYAVGGSKYPGKSTSQASMYYKKAVNKNTISIEICSNKTNKKSLKASDTDWYFTEASLANAAKLARYLMELYNIPLERIIMHHHVTGKVCPNPWCLNEGKLNEWNKFKARLVDGANVVVTPKPVDLPIYVTDITKPNDYVKIGQQHAINFTGNTIKLTGLRDANTVKQCVRVLQMAMNLDYKLTLPLSGVFDTKTKNALGNHYVKLGETQYMVTALVILLLMQGYVVPLAGNPETFNATLCEVVKTYQKLNGLAVTGIANAATFRKLIQ